jgi:hypothetical protein
VGKHIPPSSRQQCAGAGQGAFLAHGRPVTSEQDQERANRA